LPIYFNNDEPTNALTTVKLKRFFVMSSDPVAALDYWGG
jgi:hypothetical protein